MSQSEFFAVPPPPPPCTHSDTRVTLTPNMQHYAREDCNACGKFVRWLPKPETLTKVKSNAETVERLKGCRLSDWEKTFVLSLEKQGFRLSPKQQTQLDRIATERLTP